MKMLKLAVLPLAMMATSAFAAEQVVAVETAPTAVTTTSYNTATAYDPNTTVIQNTTTQVVDGTRTIVSTITHPAAISAEVGTTGYGANIAWGLNEKTELVAGWDGGKTDDKIDLDSNDSYVNWKKVLGDDYQDFKGDLDYKIKLNNPYLGVNMRPFSNYFTVGTGVIFQNNKVDATLTPSSTNVITIDNEEFKTVSGDKVAIKVQPKNDVAPYLTLGLRPNITDHFGLFAEAGAAYMGKTEATAKVTRGNNTTAAIIGDKGNSLEDVATRSLNNKNVWWPIVKVGATYRF